MISTETLNISFDEEVGIGVEPMPLETPFGPIMGCCQVLFVRGRKFMMCQGPNPWPWIEAMDMEDGSMVRICLQWEMP